MAKFRISGVWKNSSNTITHYAFHRINENSVDRAVKTTKADAIKLLDIQGNSATTWIWNYNSAKWTVGENVEVVSGENGKFLRSNPNNRITDNLEHLIDYDWITQ